MSLSALDDIQLTAEDKAAWRDSRKRFFRFKASVDRRYGKRGADFIAGYMAYAEGFRSDQGAEYYHPGAMREGYAKAMADKAEIK